MAQDFLGNEIKVGDEVAFMMRGYRALSRGKILSLAPQTCLIEMKGHWRGSFRQNHSSVILVTKSITNEPLEEELRRAFTHGQSNNEMMEAGLERNEVDDYVSSRMRFFTK